MGLLRLGRVTYVTFVVCCQFAVCGRVRGYIHTWVTNKSYQISFALSFVGGGGANRAGEEVSKQVATDSTTTQHKKKIRHCLPLMAARLHCLTPRSHNCKAWGSSSIQASRTSTGSRRCNVQTLSARGGGGKAGMWAEHAEDMNRTIRCTSAMCIKSEV